MGVLLLVLAVLVALTMGLLGAGVFTVAVLLRLRGAATAPGAVAVCLVLGSVVADLSGGHLGPWSPHSVAASLRGGAAVLVTIAAVVQSRRPGVPGPAPGRGRR